MSKKISRAENSFERTFNRSEKRVLKKLDLYLKKTKYSTLDIGTGYGRKLDYLSKRSTEVWGIEKSPTQFTKATETIKNLKQKDKIKTLLGSFLDFHSSKKFNFIFCNHIIEHVSTNEAKQIINKANSFLERGGIMFFSTAISSIEDTFYVIQEGLPERKTTKKEFDAFKTTFTTSKTRFIFKPKFIKLFSSKKIKILELGLYRQIIEKKKNIYGITDEIRSFKKVDPFFNNKEDFQDAYIIIKKL